MAMKTKFINIRIRESNDGEPTCFDIDAGGSLDDILHMLCGGMDAVVTRFCAEDGDEQMRKDMLRSMAMEILSLADAGSAIHNGVMIKIPGKGESNGQSDS